MRCSGPTRIGSISFSCAAATALSSDTWSHGWATATLTGGCFCALATRAWNLSWCFGCGRRALGLEHRHHGVLLLLGPGRRGPRSTREHKQRAPRSLSGYVRTTRCRNRTTDRVAEAVIILSGLLGVTPDSAASRRLLSSTRPRQRNSGAIAFARATLRVDRGLPDNGQRRQLARPRTFRTSRTRLFRASRRLRPPHLHDAQRDGDRRRRARRHGQIRCGRRRRPAPPLGSRPVDPEPPGRSRTPRAR